MNRSIPSDAKVLLDDWETLSRIILKVATPLRDRLEPKENSSNLIPDNIINDAVNGPFHPFFAAKLKAFAQICELRMLVTISENEALQSKKKIDKKETPTEKLAKKISITELDKKQKELDEMTNEHYAQWQELIEDWVEDIKEALEQHNVPLSNLELQELKQLEPISELLDRFTHLNIEPPKNKKDEFNFANCFKYKTDLAIHSSLSRRHQPHEKKNIDTVIKKLKPVFNAIQKEESNIAREQSAETEAAINFDK